jgi:hypothetical protein
MSPVMAICDGLGACSACLIRPGEFFLTQGAADHQLQIYELNFAPSEMAKVFIYAEELWMK